MLRNLYRNWSGTEDEDNYTTDEEETRITETSLYSFGNFRKLSLYNCFMPI